MNPANFPNVGGGMPGGAKPHGQMQIPQKNENASVIMNQVAQALQAQGPFTGWRAEVPIKDRAVKVYQMITSLRLIQPRMDFQSAAQAAMSFEQKAFKDAREKVDYDKECNEKLIHIRDTRARQAAVMQNGMMPQGPGAGMPGVGQNAFPQPMNRPVQASPMPGQQPMPMAINDPNQQGAIQQRQQQQQQQQTQAMLQQQRVQQRPAGNASLIDDLNTLSAQEYEHVSRVANQILAKTSQDDLDKIRLNLQNMAPEQRQYLTRKNMDPITYFFRTQALNQIRRHKRNRMEMARAPNAGVDPNGAVMTDPMLNPQQRQIYQNMISLQRNSGFPMGNQQNLDPSSFIGNVENIQGQQADGLRSQEAGQLVVPASSSQINQPPFSNPQNMFQVGQQMGQGGQANLTGAGISPQFLAQQHLQNPQAIQQDRTQQAAQFQPQSQAQTQAQARAQAAQKAQMAISSQAGQASSQMQQQLSQSPSMPMLNRPMPPGQMSPVQVPAQVRPPSRPPGMGQQPNSVQALAGQPGMQGRPQIPPGLAPAAAHEQLAQMSPEQLSAFLMSQQRRALASNQALARANAGQQPIPMQQNLSQAGQNQQMMNNQMSNNNQNMRTPLALQQQLAGMNNAQMSNPMLAGQQMSIQQRHQQQRQHDLYKLHLLRQQSGGLEMTPDQVKEMDRIQFPPAILTNNPNMVTPVPKHIKTWGQLKQWVSANPQALGGVDLQKLMTLQKLHLAQIVAQGKEGAVRNFDQNGQQGNWGPMMPFQGQPQPFVNPQAFQAGQQQMPMNMPVMRPITANDIQLARQRLGAQVQHYTDDQLREIIHRNRQKHIMQMAQSRAAQAAQALAAQNQNQMPQQPPVTGAPIPPTTQTKQVPQHPTPQQNQPTQAAMAPTAAPSKGTKAAPTKQGTKRKSTNEEPSEVQTTPAPKAAQPATTQGVSAPLRPNMSFTPEQLAAMTPQQRMQLIQMRRQQGPPRVPISRASAEEAWNNLPEKIRQLYGDISKSAPPAEPVAVSPEQKAAMTQQLRECTDMLGRMDTLVQWFAKIPGQEKNVRSLLAMRIQLMRQFKPGPDWTLNDHITIAPEYLTGTINYIKRLFHAMIARVNQQQNQPSGQRPGVSQGPPVMQQTNQNNMLALNASNLQQLQQQEEALQRARRASSQAASVASAVLQPPFGAPSPQGVPHAYGPGGIPPEKLKIPPSKKRKQSHPGGTPIQGQAPGTPLSKFQAIKQPAPNAKSTALLAGPFKCSVLECRHHHQGFATQDALDKHAEESHKVEEPISDPLEFALESFRTSLVKDDEGAQPQDLKKTGVAPPPTKHEAKAEAIPQMPMGRTPGQPGAKPASPAAQQTPRTTHGKASTAAPKPSPGKGDKKEAGKPVHPAAPPAAVVTKDPWAESAISLETIHDTFMDLGDEAGFGFNPMDEFINSDMFASVQSEDTPDSVESGIATQTPKDTELPKAQDAGGKLGVVSGDNWIPGDWVNVPLRFEDHPMVNDSSWENFDWDAVERDTAMTVDENGVAIYAI